MDRRLAAPLAAKVVAALADSCERVLVAGALRRGERDIRQLDIVCAPKRLIGGVAFAWGTPVAEVPQHEVDRRLAQLEAARRIVRDPIHKEFGPRQKNYLLTATNLPLRVHLAPPHAFGLAAAIWTGDDRFARALVTARKKGGFLPDGWKVRDAALVDDTQRSVSCATEEELFAVLGLPPVAPHERTLIRAQGIAGLLAGARQQEGGSIYDSDHTHDRA